ncbi:sensor histidine kinase [Alteraurantiacibacter aquimixticola]|uniref:histidine kinase n=1 Tax=Alteraurantiacibacter aquimixticola TaxID=2489173 RepID=A0A4T3F0A3_9SPHN|nr:PAS domain S-box protein [Alteraurantiacibacter aquimixticola]TIX50459.1 PAS domain S-box protein [Alteraurantiacibacter aquimixticola]
MIGVYDFYAALVESSDDAIVAKDTNSIVIAWNPAAERLFGWTAEEMIGQSIRRLLPDDRQHEEDEILERISRGEKVGQFLTRRLHKSGVELDISVTVSPVRDEMGTVVGASKIARDARPFLEREERLRESQELFQTLADNIAPFAWMARPDGHIFWYNKRWYDYTGTTLEEMEGWGWKKVHHPEHVDRVVERIQHSWDTGEEWEDIFPLRSKGGEYRWFLSRALPIRDENGDILRWFGTNSDITEQREQAEQIRLLLMEVNHRSKNMLSTIQALLRRSVDGNDELIERFQQRVRSLAVNQDILVRREWREVPLDELVRLQLAFVEDAPGTIVTDGPDIPLTPRAAETIGMALHELATNSLKYGALSVDAGKVEISWAVDAATGFSMSWQESGGPEVSPPQRKGFGSTLISEIPKRTFGSDADILYAPEGIRWSLRAPIDMVEAGKS